MVRFPFVLGLVLSKKQERLHSELLLQDKSQTFGFFDMIKPSSKLVQ